MASTSNRNVGYLVTHAGRLLDKQLAQRLQNLGMSTTTYRLLRSIGSVTDRPVMVVDVADDLRMDPVTVANDVKQAADEGWIVVEPVPRARRARILSLTARAKTARPVMADAAHWSLETGLNGFTREEIERFRDYLERFAGNLELAERLYSERS